MFDRGAVESTLEQYGIDWEGPCPDNETDSDCVTVPRINLHLPSNILQIFIIQWIHSLLPNFMEWTFILFVYDYVKPCYKNIQPINIESP